MSEIVSCDAFEALLDGMWENGNPHHASFVACALLALLTFVVSSVTGNVSQVDKLWSILPALYAWMCVCDVRTLIMAGISTLWSARLTYNFYRRGGYSWPPWQGEEDYRWPYIRKGSFLKLLKNPAVFLVFNFFFISAFQNVLLLLIASPSLVCWSVAMAPTCQESGTRNATSLNALDGIAVLIFILSIWTETIADRQQYEFQTKKYEMKRAGMALAGEYSDGFRQTGLFAIVRKPNYAAEQMIWFSYFLFSVAATGGLWNWSGWGIVFLVLLFQGSGWLTEKISIEKYPEYLSYQHAVPLYVPSIRTVIRALGKNVADANVSKDD